LAEYRSPIEIIGESGTLFARDGLNVERPIEIELRREGKVVETEVVSNHLAYGKQVDAFSAAIEGGASFPVPGEEGWQNQAILDAAFRSLKNSKAEVVFKVAQ
jgi:predicted dehydrogenase